MKNDINKNEIGDKRGGKRGQKVTEEIKLFLINRIETDPLITLKQLSELVRLEFQITISQPTISKILQGALITLKTIRFVPNTANNDSNKARRKLYVETLLNYRSQEFPVVYVDETNFNLFISRSQGRSMAGSRVNVIRPASRGRNIHLIGAIGTK